MELAYAILEEVRVSGRPLFPISWSSYWSPSRKARLRGEIRAGFGIEEIQGFGPEAESQGIVRFPIIGRGPIYWGRIRTDFQSSYESRQASNGATTDPRCAQSFIIVEL